MALALLFFLLICPGISALIDERGDGYSLFHPFPSAKPFHNDGLLGTPEMFVAKYERQVVDLNKLLDEESVISSPAEHARDMYFSMLMQFINGRIFEENEMSVGPSLVRSLGVLKGEPLTSTSEDKRNQGEDWPGFGLSMTGQRRLVSVRNLLVDVFEKKVAGAVAETGVWRGGMSIFMRAVMRVYGEGDRLLFVCDSFNGLPPTVLGEELHLHWDGVPFLQVSDSTVKTNFEMMGVADPNIVFVKGFFSATMGPLSKAYTGKFAILRLDGDMYESTVDVLYNLYERLSVGGYIIIDDWFGGFQAKTACIDFFIVHSINPEIVPVDSGSVYWQKAEEIEVQYWRYQQKRFRQDASDL